MKLPIFLIDASCKELGNQEFPCVFATMLFTKLASARGGSAVVGRGCQLFTRRGKDSSAWAAYPGVP